MKKLSIFEIIWYSLCGALALWGLAYTTLGLIGSFISPLDNPLKEASDVIAETFGGLGFLLWGLIILSVAAVAAIIVLLVFSKKYDREQEKALRRQARRLGINQEATEETQISE